MSLGWFLWSCVMVMFGASLGFALSNDDEAAGVAIVVVAVTTLVAAGGYFL